MDDDSSFRAALRATWPKHKPRISSAGLASLTLGLAPFYPHAHVWKQLVNLVNGTLTEPIDIFDLVLHGAPWVVLIAFTAQFLLAASRNHSQRRAQHVSPT
ncbi:MAG: hypothetical protein KC619_32380 [Myxococcales bacterium]|nr:hypothetical protein [Myxococcales bacterium]